MLHRQTLSQYDARDVEGYFGLHTSWYLAACLSCSGVIILVDICICEVGEERIGHFDSRMHPERETGGRGELLFKKKDRAELAGFGN